MPSKLSLYSAVKVYLTFIVYHQTATARGLTPTAAGTTGKMSKSASVTTVQARTMTIAKTSTGLIASLTSKVCKVIHFHHWVAPRCSLDIYCGKMSSRRILTLEGLGQFAPQRFCLNFAGVL
jgi:hypothetical protein